MGEEELPSPLDEDPEVILDRISDVFFALDAECRVTYLSSKAEDLVRETMDVRPEAVIGESLWDLIPEARDSIFYEKVIEAMETQEPVEFETESFVQEGWRAVRAYPSPEGLSVYFTDITDRKQRERELEQYETIVDTVPVGIFVLDEEARIVGGNDRSAEMLGYEFEELTDEPFQRLIEDGVFDSSVVEDYLERVRTLLSDDTQAEQMTLEHPVTVNGDERILESTIALRPFDAEFRGTIGVLRDITEERRRERELQRQNERLDEFADELEHRERVLREMYDIIADRDRPFTEQVSALLELGRTELDASYGTLSEIEGDDYLFEVVAADDDSIEAGDVVPVSATNCEIAARTQRTLVLGDVARDAPDETDRAGYTEWGIACYIGAPVYVGDEVYGTFCFYDTEPRQGQFSEWERTLVDLMSRWVSNELERQQRQEELQTQNERLEEFAGVVSHDLRNPLNVAEGRLDLAQEEVDSEHLDVVASAHDRMKALIDDLLTLASEGARVSDAEEIDLAQITNGCWRNVETDEATLVTATERTIIADRSRFQQLLENLFRNAIEHGGDDVTITVGDLEGGFFVEDDGPGIADGARDEIFDPGYSTSEAGTGFGLSIVEQVADAHGWSIRVTDGSDGGARFEITGVEFVEI